MFRKIFLLSAIVFSLSLYAIAQAVPRFDAARLVNLGDSLHYGSYDVVKIGQGIFHIADPGDPKAKMGGAVGTDDYIILGKSKALMIDLGNNYIDGYTKDAILPRPNAAAELLAIVDALVGKLPLEIAITHAHPDHDGMTGAFTPRKTVIWMPRGEDLEAPRTQHKIDPAVYTVFDQDSKTFDLGGGRVVTPIALRGHSKGCTTYLLPSDSMLFTGDCLGFGIGQLIGSADILKTWASETDHLVGYINAHLTPYQRYALRVYTGHQKNTPIAGWLSSLHGKIDIDYLDWRYVQDQARCAAAIMKGEWTNPDSGLRLVQVSGPGGGQGKSPMFIYDTGGVRISVEQAEIAAGLRPASPTATPK